MLLDITAFVEGLVERYDTTNPKPSLEISAVPYLTASAVRMELRYTKPRRRTWIWEQLMMPSQHQYHDFSLYTIVALLVHPAVEL